MSTRHSASPPVALPGRPITLVTLPTLLLWLKQPKATTAALAIEANELNVIAGRKKHCPTLDRGLRRLAKPAHRNDRPLNRLTKQIAPNGPFTLSIAMIGIPLSKAPTSLFSVSSSVRPAAITGAREPIPKAEVRSTR